MKARHPQARLSMAEIERRLSVMGSVRSTNLPACEPIVPPRPNPRRKGA